MERKTKGEDSPIDPVGFRAAGVAHRLQFVKLFRPLGETKFRANYESMSREF